MCCNEGFVGLIDALQRHLKEVLMKMFKDLQHHALSIQFRFDSDSDALQNFIHDLMSITEEDRLSDWIYPQHVKSERQEDLSDTWVHHNEGFRELIIGLQR